MSNGQLLMKPAIRLLTGELSVARFVANQWRNNATGSSNKDPWSGRSDIRAAAGELAVAKWLGAYWLGPRSISSASAGDGGDIIGGIEVKSIKERHHKLIVQLHNPADAYYILARPLLPDFTLWTIVGGISGHRAMQSVFLDSSYGKEAYFIPQQQLDDPAVTYQCAMSRIVAASHQERA